MDPDNTNAVDVDTENPAITSITSSTPDRCYNVGDDINVTVAFSENVTCSGDFFQVPLDTGGVLQWGAFALTDTISGTYGVGSGDNSCDLDSGMPSLAGVATLKDAAGNDADLVLSTPTSIASGSNITVDTTAPVINPIASAETIECDGEGNVTDLNAWLNSHGGANATDNCSGVTWTNDFTSLSDNCGETGSATVTFTATDTCGNFSTTEATFTIEDTTPPSITTPASDETVECDGVGNTTELNAWFANHGGAVASDTSCGTDITWSNDFMALSDDCGETGSALVTFTATDDCDLSSTTQATFTVEDTTIPVINDLVVDDHVLVSADCCETTDNFTANVTDNC